MFWSLVLLRAMFGVSLIVGQLTDPAPSVSTIMVVLGGLVLASAARSAFRYLRRKPVARAL